MTKLPLVFSRLTPAKSTKVFDTYWRFAAERQAIFFRRMEGELPETWTQDPIIGRYKFTNSYRASDRVSQYLIKNVIYAGDQSPEEVFFRTIIFKIFHRIETWELLEREFGVVSYRDYSFKSYDSVLTRARKRGARIYSAAYIMPSGNRVFGYRQKHRNNLRMLELMMEDEAALRIADAGSMKEAFERLRSYPLIGDFLAYQYVTDLNYSELTKFSETEFAARGIDFRTLWGRPLQLIDCQNLFCEVDKYARIAHPEFSNGRTRIKQNYRHNAEPIEYWYPPKWKLNGKIRKAKRAG
jgi:hypothetical protein